MAKPPIARADGVALCFEGGGMRASYTAAVSQAIEDLGLDFPYVCGVSAGSSLTVNHVARDAHRSRLQFVDYADDPRFGGLDHFLRGEGYFNSDYLYEGCVESGEVPVRWGAFCENPAEAAMQAFSADTGRTRVWHKADYADPVDLAHHARASSTMPLLMNPVEIEGELWFDGGLGDRGGLPHGMALADGYERLVVVTTRPRGYRKETLGTAQRLLARRALARYPRVAEALIARAQAYNDALAELEDMERRGQALVIRPDAMPVDNACLDRARLEASWDAGYIQAARDLERVVAFCGL